MRKLINWADVTLHKILVMWFVLKACWALIRRGITHDLSKYSRHEAPYYERLFFELQAVEYGSAEYYNLQNRLAPAKQHHYSVNRHHPEYWSEKRISPMEMSPLDQIEMLCDWKASIMSHKGGNMRQSLDVNLNRYHFSAWQFAGLVDMATEMKVIE